MIENRLELDIISLYDNNLKSLFSINQISKKLDKKYPYINKKVKQLIKSDILQKINFGRSHLCSINLDSDRAIILLSLNEIRKKERFLCDLGTDMNQMLNRIKNEIDMHSIIAIPGKDERIIFICRDERDIIRLQRQKKGMKLRCEAMTSDGFKQELCGGKNDMFSNHVVLYGYERFFELISQIDEKITDIYSPMAF